DHLAELRGDQATQDIPVVMLTSVTARTGLKFGPDTVAEYVGSEPEAYIDKPIDPATLRETVGKLIGG
ncbi:MAG: response regulator, partial [Planctomycetota bacterium]